MKRRGKKRTDLLTTLLLFQLLLCNERNHVDLDLYTRKRRKKNIYAFLMGFQIFSCVKL